MKSGCICYLLSCVIFLRHSGITLKQNGHHLNGYNYEELSVTGNDLKMCENQRNVCVMNSMDCRSVPRQGTEMFLNTSCHYRIHERSFVCKWIYLNDATEINSFIFTKTTAFSHCPSIFNSLSKFNLTIKSKNVNKLELFSNIYGVSIENITQPPRPTIMSVNTTETSINVTWMSGQRYSHACRIQHKSSTTERGTMVSLTLFEEKSLETFYTIKGLQPFSLYILTVSCKGSYGIWSEWSAEYQAMTRESAPTTPPYVSYCVEPVNHTTQKLLLLWRALERSEAQGVILGYEVTYTPAEQTSLKRIISTTDLKAALLMPAGNYSLTVKAYNSAGQSPPQRVGIITGFDQRLPAVKGLWAINEDSSLKLRWGIEKTAVNVSEFAIEWFPFGDVAPKQWKRVQGSSLSTILTGNIGQLNISVYPLYDTLCGPPQTIQASLKHGTFLDIVQLKLVNVTRTTVTVKWVWEEKAPSLSVLQYRLALRSVHETRSLVVFPHQWIHTFYRLQTNVKYTVYIYGETTFGNHSKENIEFTIPYLENDDIIKAVVPAVLLIIGFVIFSILSRTIYKDSFSNIANPGHSVIGNWLLNRFYERDTIISVLKLEDFALTSQSIEKCLIQIDHPTLSDEEDFEEDHFLSKMYQPQVYPEENSESVEKPLTPPGLTEYVDSPLILNSSGYVDNCHIPGSTS